MSLNRAAGWRAARARLGRAGAGLGDLPQRVVTWSGKHRGVAVAVVIIGAEVAAGAIIAAAPLRPGGAEPVRPYAGPAASYPARPAYPVWAVLPPRHTTVYEPTGAGLFVPVGPGVRAADPWPRIAITYSGWDLGFKWRFAVHARGIDAIPLIQMEPRGVSLAAIARGAYDAHFRAFADAVANYRGAVIIEFGQEMNEPLYSWGDRKTSPGVFVGAWQRIVDVFRWQHVDNVIWIWTIGKSSAAARPLRDWWPGARYVTWVGIGGYYELPGRAPLSAFAGTIASVRRITGDPVLLFGDNLAGR
ncbi:MAG TPA: glycosyl hydrolase [Streptosporangiaceae bacterium]